MVTVYLRGGLGNQMFQYAAALAVAKKNCTVVHMDTVFLNDRTPRRQFAYRTYDLGVFALEQRFTHLGALSNTLPIPGVWMALDLASIKIADVLGVQKLVRVEDDHAYVPEAANAKGNVFLWGRWQNEKYFHDVEHDVREAFVFRTPLEGEARAIAARMAGDRSVSLHVRRGDFAALKAAQTLHGKTNLEYYQDATKYIMGKVKNPQFFVISDDITWCKENIKLDAPVEYLSAETAGPHDAYHLQLMSLCRHHIIANSTFSWWGAWLDPRPGKIVVAPARWYADREEQPEMALSGWVKL